MKHDKALDVIKVFSIYMVIIIHESASYFYDIGNEKWWIVNLYESISRCSVPLFFMVTGAVLLGKETSKINIYNKLKFSVSSLLIWSLVYYIWFKLTTSDYSYSIGNLIERPVSSHLWYLYALTGFYAVLPIINFIYRNNEKILKYTLALIITSCSIIPTLNSLSVKITSFFDISTFSIYIGYGIMGKLLTDRLITNKPENNKKNLALYLAGYILSVSAIYFLTLNATYTEKRGIVDYYQNNSFFVFISSIFAFLFIYTLCSSKNKVIKILLDLSEKLTPYVFGIYLIHYMFIYTQRNISFNALNFTPFISIPAIALLVLLASLLLIYTISKTPLLKKIIRF
jgi:surface polysaccharide O-acyltransferase-like enzyme|nr:MAG TPA: putative O-acyltransferase [Caudoviricetes sp.]